MPRAERHDRHVHRAMMEFVKEHDGEDATEADARRLARSMMRRLSSVSCEGFLRAVYVRDARGVDRRIGRVCDQCGTFALDGDAFASVFGVVPRVTSDALGEVF